MLRNIFQKKKYDILIMAPLCGIDQVMAEHLAAHGMRVVLARRPNRGAMGVPEGYFKAFDPQRDMRMVHTPLDTLKLALQSRLILSGTGELSGQLGRLWRFRHILGLPPFINMTTGSDISELIAENSAMGRRYRQYAYMAALNWVLPVPHGLRNMVRFKIPRVVFMQGFPYPMPEPDPALLYTRVPRETLNLFHCSHIDWNYTNFSPARTSTKGNIKFLRAFIRAVRDGIDLHLTILDRGADRHIARQMFEQSGVSDHVTWKENMSREELYTQMQKAHVVVNMFHHGGAGGISYETLRLGVPVLQYANPTYFRLMYAGSVPPFINAHSEEDIYQKLKWAQQTTELPAISEEGKKWIKTHIDPKSSLSPFLFYYSLLTGDERFDYGLFINEMEEHVQNVLAGRHNPLEGLTKDFSKGEKR